MIPIAYAHKGSQHAQHLASYKGKHPSHYAQTKLSALMRVFLREHRQCLVNAAGGQFTHYCVVPSTNGRSGNHPLHRLIQLTIPHICATPNPQYSANRKFYKDRFSVPDQLRSARVLVLDDTWTTGSRIRGLCHALKYAGATAAVPVVLGRHLDPGFAATKTLIEAAQSQAFDIRRCCLEGD